jgi:hypothetical protein
MAVPAQVMGAVAVGLMVVETGLAAPAVQRCGGAKIIVKTKTAPTAAPSAFKVLLDFRVCDLLIASVPSGGG